MIWEHWGNMYMNRCRIKSLKQDRNIVIGFSLLAAFSFHKPLNLVVQDVQQAVPRPLADGRGWLSLLKNPTPPRPFWPRCIHPERPPKIGHSYGPGT